MSDRTVLDFTVYVVASCYPASENHEKDSYETQQKTLSSDTTSTLIKMMRISISNNLIFSNSELVVHTFSAFFNRFEPLPFWYF